MQNRMESNIRDKFLVKMIKLQEFTEKKRIAEMLNEMNPKLKALLAAGLIGTAGLGMQSCSNPSDSVYYPYTVETPSTDNPGSGGGTENLGNGGGAETSNPSGGEENGGNGGETEVNFESLGVTDSNAQEIIAYTTAIESGEFSVNYLKGKAKALSGKGHVYLYKETEPKGFQVVSEDMTDSEVPISLIGYARNNNHYYIPESMGKSFDKAIAAYRASQSNQ